MADFQQSIAVVLQNEGGYKAADSTDPGGETYKGISRGNFPAWEGWTVIDTAKKFPLFPKSLEENQLLQMKVLDFYQKEFWQFSAIKSQDLATKLLDLCVNMGKGTGITMLQQIFKKEYGLAASIDGKWGPNTELFVNRPSPQALLKLLRVAAAVHYGDIAKSNPAEWDVDKHGWMARAIS